MALSPKLRFSGTLLGISIQRMEIVLIYDHVGTNPTVISEWLTLISDMEGTNPLTMTKWQQPLYLIKWEHIPQSHQNGHALTSDHVRLHLIII